MKTLTDEKLTIVGAAGMIGSNMAQTAIMMGLTSNICLYDPYAPGLEGVAEELFHCGFEGVNITFTSDIKEALTGAKYIVNSGGAVYYDGTEMIICRKVAYIINITNFAVHINCKHECYEHTENRKFG